jgi:hypothetical protein
MKKPWLLALPWWLLWWVVVVIKYYLLSYLWIMHFMLRVWYLCATRTTNFVIFVREKKYYPCLTVVGTWQLFCVMSCCNFHLIMIILMF